MTNLNVSNPATCYKVLRRGIIQQVRIDQDRFEFEPESTPEVRHRKGVRNSEVPVSYHLRTHDEREKIGWHDDFNASPCIVRRSSFHRP
ncbi:MAG: hypothetical protein K8T90_03955 [Planctomycetes bacterium]|nr:hypothetical protein [Planctomycetota bacterium]